MEHQTPQTVAQAVQAATQQISQPSPPLPAPTSTIDNLTCQWQACGERCDSAEALYDHVCERHVGRKSTNNLNLTCQWGPCRTTTVKRDHITSHIRVHVPLKPHKCEFCGKAFKRPQDLKKHVKTHAEDSVLSSPQHGHSGRIMGNGGMNPTNGKPSGYYPAHEVSLGNPYPSYQPAMTAAGNTAQYAHTGGNNQYAGYGSVSYPNSAAMADIQSLDTRRRAIEALNDFLGDIKRRAIDPNSYYDVGGRLQTNALPLPVGSGYNTGYNNSVFNSNYNTATLLESFNNGGTLHNHVAAQPAVSTHGYALPLPNARTKSDLQDIDRFLEQLQSTVYENSVHGVQHSENPIFAPYTHQNSTYRHSPPHSLDPVHGTTPSSVNTPVHTPSSTYSASLSPISNHSRTSFGSGYPTLPTASGVSDLSAYTSATSAPAPILAHDYDTSRRHSGSQLRKVVPPSSPHDQDVEMGDDTDGNRTPRPEDARPKSKGDSSIDPALRGEEAKSPGTATATSESETDKRQEEWVENIRVIEALRKWIGDRLKIGDFDDAALPDAFNEVKEFNESKDAADVDMKTVETAKMVAEKLAGSEQQDSAQEPVQEQSEMKDGAGVEYPKLPTA